MVSIEEARLVALLACGAGVVLGYALGMWQGHASTREPTVRESAEYLASAQRRRHEGLGPTRGGR